MSDGCVICFERVVEGESIMLIENVVVVGFVCVCCLFGIGFKLYICFDCGDFVELYKV